MKRLLFLLLPLFLCPVLYGQTGPWSGILVPSRAATWSYAGVSGGIPTGRTQCVTSACSTVVSNAGSSTEAQIEAAWASAPANTYVFLPAGTYNIPCLNLRGVSNVTLRGAGANQTILPVTGSCSGAGINLNSSDGNDVTNPNNPSGCGSSNSSCAAVTGTVSQGSTTITLSKVPNLKVGNPIFMDQLDTQNDNGGILVLGTGSSYTGPSTPPGNSGPYSIDGEQQGSRNCSSSSPAACYHQQQIVFVTQCDGVTTVGHSCSSGSNITINPPIQMSNWNTANMYAYWGTSPIQYSGIEDLLVDATNDSGIDGIHIFNCSNCWAKGVAVYDTSLAHILVQDGTNDTVDNSYFFLTQNHVTSSYGVVCIAAQSLLVENNIFHAVASPVILNGPCHGAVVGYNYNINDYYTASVNYNQNFYGVHAAGIDTILLEGNVANQADADNIHGTSNLGTYFRNAFTGPLPACYASGSSYASATYGVCNGGTAPVELWSFHRFYNVIGNVLGTSGVDTTYNPGTACNGCVYVMGVGNTVPNDPNVQATAMLWGNADSATGFGSPRFNCSEVPTALTGVQAPYANPCPSSQSLPPSFYYSAKPSWWPSGKPWPIIGPDVSGGNISICSSGTYIRSLVNSVSLCTAGTGSTGMSGLANSNPAMDCYLSLGGLPNGTGPALSNFNEGSCYAQTVSGNPPQPPTNLSATVD